MLEIVTVGDYSIDFSRQKIFKKREEIILSKKISGASAWAFLELLVNANGRILTYNVLDASGIWQDDRGKGVDHRSSIKTWASEFNKVLGGKAIKNKSRIGYYFDVSVPETADNVTIPIDVSISNFTTTFEDWSQKALNAIMSCDIKWGAYTLDNEIKYTNTCEALLALITTGSIQTHEALITQAVLKLFQQNSKVGIISKTLSTETVVPTAMYVCVISELIKEHVAVSEEIIQEAKRMVCNIWNSRSEHGWGIYVKKQHKQHANIGCTFWALKAISCFQELIPQQDITAFVKQLFSVQNTSCYGETVFDSCLRPRLYSTAMMALVYLSLLREQSKNMDFPYSINTALDYVIEHFDNVLFLSEREEIYGCDDAETVTVNCVSWTHITIRYCLELIGVAIQKDLISTECTAMCLERIVSLLARHSFTLGNSKYWDDGAIGINGRQRGYKIYPTMNVLVGLAKINQVLNEKYIGGNYEHSK